MVNIVGGLLIATTAQAPFGGLPLISPHKLLLSFAKHYVDGACREKAAAGGNVFGERRR